MLIHIAARVRIPFLFKAESYSTLSTPTMFIRPSRDRQVASTFLLLQIMLNVSVKTSVQVPPFSSLGYVSADHVTIPRLVSLRNPTDHFPQQLSSFTCHTSNAEELQLLHLLNSRYGRQRVCRVPCRARSCFALPYRLAILSIFLCACGHSHTFFGEISIQVLGPFLNRVVDNTYS